MKRLVDRPRLKATWRRKTASAPMGRFGGGWQWMVGARASGGFRTVIIHLLIADLRIEFPRQPSYREIIQYTTPNRSSAAAKMSRMSLADADLAIDYDGRVLKDRYGREGRMATADEIAAARKI